MIKDRKATAWTATFATVATQLSVGLVWVERLLSESFSLSEELGLWGRGRSAVILAALALCVARLVVGRVYAVAMGGRWSDRLHLRGRGAQVEPLCFALYLTSLASYSLLLWNRSEWSVSLSELEWSGWCAAGGGLMALMGLVAALGSIDHPRWRVTRTATRFGWTLAHVVLALGLITLNLGRLEIAELRSRSSVATLVGYLLVDGLAILMTVRMLLTRRSQQATRLANTPSLRWCQSLLGNIPAALTPFLATSQASLTFSYMAASWVNAHYWLATALAGACLSLEGFEYALLFGAFRRDHSSPPDSASSSVLSVLEGSTRRQHSTSFEVIA